MKNLGFLNKIVFLVNVAFATLLLFSYALPFVFPKSFPSLSVFSLTVPILILVNILFLIYWLLRLKKQLFLSLVILVLGYNHILSFYRLPVGSSVSEENPGAFSVMSYNVRLFNRYEWIPEKGIDGKILDFLRKESPDVLCLQEFYYEKEDMFSQYTYRYIRYKTKNQKTGQAIFSKFPIVNRGSLEFPNTGNNAIFADIVNKDDTIRVYNLHLESLRINPEKEVTQEESERMFKRMGLSFTIQQNQAELFKKHNAQCPFPKIVCGDFNNTQYSNIYRQVRGDMKDTFEEAGKGFGRTFNFKYFPVRIDFILADPEIDVLTHTTFSQVYSDHFPIAATLVSP
ncbi:endonuclease/exonuclease/phosphatase family protein [Ascidiimonas aurantiaca]|uniref:endonuclease/exonuclease/phosphatase family protein n=1 Tax=Ascidiimonas aurantiaca TaxID=1685432 RepID=UPI0030EDBC42